jgi:hypothetical protein
VGNKIYIHRKIKITKNLKWREKLMPSLLNLLVLIEVLLLVGGSFQTGTITNGDEQVVFESD